MMLPCCYSSSVFVEINVSFFIYYYGFYFKNKIHETPIPTVKHPVTIKLYVHGSLLDWSNILQRTKAIILPTFAFIPQKPIKRPRFPFPNQFPTIPITPGHPVL